MHFHIQKFTHSPEILINVQITNSYNTQTHLFELLCTFCISGCLCFLIVTPAVQFYNKLCFCTIEIRNKFTECLLPLKTDRVLR